MTQAGTQAFEHGPPFDIPRVVDDVIRFSVRNGPAVRTSIDETLRVADRRSADLGGSVAATARGRRDSRDTRIATRHAGRRTHRGGALAGYQGRGLGRGEAGTAGRTGLGHRGERASGYQRPGRPGTETGLASTCRAEPRSRRADAAAGVAGPGGPCQAGGACPAGRARHARVPPDPAGRPLAAHGTTSPPRVHRPETNPCRVSAQRRHAGSSDSSPTRSPATSCATSASTRLVTNTPATSASGLPVPSRGSHPFNAPMAFPSPWPGVLFPIAFPPNMPVNSPQNLPTTSRSIPAWP